MMFQAVLSNRDHLEYGVATIPFPIPRDQYAHCMELLEALEIGDTIRCSLRQRYEIRAGLRRSVLPLLLL